MHVRIHVEKKQVGVLVWYESMKVAVSNSCTTLGCTWSFLNI